MGPGRLYQPRENHTTAKAAPLSHPLQAPAVANNDVQRRTIRYRERRCIRPQFAAQLALELLDIGFAEQGFLLLSGRYLHELTRVNVIDKTPDPKTIGYPWVRSDLMNLLPNVLFQIGEGAESSGDDRHFACFSL